MSKLKVNELDTESGTTITVAAGKTIAGTDIIGATQIVNDAVTPAKINIFDDALAATTTHFLIADGTDYSSFALSGDITSTNAGAVTIADNAVSLAKMAGLARGSIIVGDASGDPSALTKGSANQVLKSDGTDVAWGADAGGKFASYACLADQKAGNASMTSITAGAYRERDINTEVCDADGIVTISANQFTLAAGSYFIKYQFCAYQGNGQNCRLYDVTNSTVIQYGWTTYLDGVHNYEQTLMGMGRVTPAASTAYSVQHRVEATAGGPGGVPAFGQANNVYLFVEIFKES